MTRVFISIGSNIDRQKNIRGAVRELTTHYGSLSLSPVYECKAYGFDGENFYNLVVGFDTDESVEQIKKFLLQIEAQFGRTRTQNRFSARTLDLDLLLHGNTIRHDDKVNLPHPDIERYAFVLGPLADIAPHLQHPETKLAYSQMWENLHEGKQQMWKTDFDPQT
ncbi:MAG: 2-amino-4-hydroxy-6-hydroxymethyldihydropteridine diphosphokinase [Gammaproteobacteria bacterium]|nr:2-amino-4-hydroxy-6-hydroxymethyldihydropteridine diphosphokinase [Gammaproteobacteria bacterium]